MTLQESLKNTQQLIEITLLEKETGPVATVMKHATTASQHLNKHTDPRLKKHSTALADNKAHYEKASKSMTNAAAKHVSTKHKKSPAHIHLKLASSHREQGDRHQVGSEHHMYHHAMAQAHHQAAKKKLGTK